MDTGRVVRAAAIAAGVLLCGVFTGALLGVLSMCAGDGPEFPY